MANSYNTNSGTNSYSPSLKKLELQNTHEQVQLKEEHDHEEKMANLKYLNEQNIKDKECQHKKSMNNQSLGWFGRFFGSKDNSSRNITGAICLSFVAGTTIVSLVVYFCKDDTEFVKSMWGVTSPIITLSLGYLFGKK